MQDNMFSEFWKPNYSSVVGVIFVCGPMSICPEQLFLNVPIQGNNGNTLSKLNWDLSGGRCN